MNKKLKTKINPYMEKGNCEMKKRKITKQSTPEIEGAVYRTEFGPRECTGIRTGVCPVENYSDIEELNDNNDVCIEIMKNMKAGIYEDSPNPVRLVFDPRTEIALFLDGRHRACVYAHLHERSEVKVETEIIIEEKYDPEDCVKREGDFTMPPNKR